ncbi:hypothetical protein H0I23_02455 [Cellulophaga sp. HaHaR_3_176]|uniref:DUF6452 family protein n=1 Tax=Cellulophaga sp. HaHaR_3_176 TaxID=1942464 RepID=UPI001C1FAAB7|nr:DUF6452 family protein [Cellulophaga sp. HaHaR_3_176]QWX84526.1 hypothetical protein H0I23_02455 [Cellulophaga sp. HaHaR_3_176]
MKLFKYLSLVTVITLTAIFLNSCEKDDICVDGTTPLMVVEFYDFEDKETRKDPSNLIVTALLDDDTFGDIITNTATDSLNIPLRIEELTTVYSFSTNTTTDEANDNVDIITFNYTTNDLFISRACGFIVNYENLSAELTIDELNWIKEVEIANAVIENQTTTHVKIYH